MGFLIAFAFGLFVFVSGIVLPWVNRDRIGDLKEKIEELEEKILWLKREYEAKLRFVQPGDATKEAAKKAEASPIYHTETPVQPKPFVAPETVLGAAYRQPDAPPVMATPAKAEKELRPIRQMPVPERVTQTEPAQDRSLEQQFGGRIFVWLGGIALALAGVFLVKYSIESGLLTENVRVILGIIFGMSLLCGSAVVRVRVADDGIRISQALAGAGIADLYGCLFAATTLYHLVPSWFGFGCMAAVTALALIMSLRYGAPIAVLGLVGGYVTPLLIHGEPHTAMLFGYLYLVFAGLTAVIRRQEWWWLSIPATLIAYGWVFLWLFTGDIGVDGPCLSMFLLAISATVVFATRSTENDDAFSTQSWFGYLAVGGAIVLMAAVTGRTGFEPMEWDMFGLFSLGAIILARFDHDTYGFAPWLALAANATMLLTWNTADPTAFAITTTLFSLMFVASSYALMPRSTNPVSWAGLSVASATTYYLLAYDHIGHTVTDVLPFGTVLSADAIWAIIAFALTALFAATAVRLSRARHADDEPNIVPAIFTCATAGFLSLGLLILLHREFLAFAIAAQILAVSWIDTKADIRVLRPIAIALTVLFGILITPEMIALFSSVFDNDAMGQFQNLHSYSSLLFRLGLPAAMFMMASGFLRRRSDGKLTGVMEIISLALFTAMTHDFIGMILPGSESAFLARGFFTDVLLGLSFGAVLTGRHYARPAIKSGGIILGGFSVARIAGFDLILDNPLWSHVAVGAWPLLNGLLAAYGLPVFLIAAVGYEIMDEEDKDVKMVSRIFNYVLAFTFISLNVRQFYHGTYLDAGFVSNAEVYSYSAAWLTFGVALLIAGAVREDRMMRTASMVIMILTVGKVFLYDASELTGLWRVVSFLGLGFSLLGLSWFYSRFVFGNKKP